MKPDQENVYLPPSAVLDAGLAKFTELCKLNWPDDTGNLVAFDMRKTDHMRVTLGLVYMAMRKVELERD